MNPSMRQRLQRCRVSPFLVRFFLSFFAVGAFVVSEAYATLVTLSPPDTDQRFFHESELAYRTPVGFAPTSTSHIGSNGHWSWVASEMPILPGDFTGIEFTISHNQGSGHGENIVFHTLKAVQGVTLDVPGVVAATAPQKLAFHTDNHFDFLEVFYSIEVGGPLGTSGTVIKLRFKHIPEPGTLSLLALGSLMLVSRRRRTR